MTMRRRGLALLLAVLIVLGPTPAWATNCSPFRTWSTGDSLSASDLNSSFTAVATTNMTPQCLGDYSANSAQMNTTTDPNSSGSASLATSGSGELERLRYVLAHTFGRTQWWTHYEDLNIGNRGLRQHATTLTGYKELIRTEAHLSAASVRFHLVSIGVTEYVPGAAHPESALVLVHVNATRRFMVGIGGDVHVGSTLAVHAAGVAAHPAIYKNGDASGVFWPAAHVVAVSTGGTERARVDGAGKLGIGNTNPLNTLHVSGAAMVQDSLHVGSSLVARAAVVGGMVTLSTVEMRSSNNYPIAWNDAAGGTTNQAYLILDTSNDLQIYAGNLARVTVFSNGGVNIGAPAGGSKGAGTLNAAGDIYKNNTAYANPDFVFERWATGSVTHYADRLAEYEHAVGMPYLGLRSLDETEQYARTHWRLPLISDQPSGTFARADMLLATVEEAYLYLFDLHRRVRALEDELATMKETR